MCGICPSTTATSEPSATSRSRSCENEITALIGPSGCGKTTFLRCLNRMNDLIESARVEGQLLYHGVDLYDEAVDPVEVRRRIGMVFQKPNPFPKSIYDNIAFGPKIAGYEGRHGRSGRGVPSTGGALGRGEGQAEGVGTRALGRAAAAVVHRPGDRHAARRDLDGRALLVAGPDRHGEDRGPDAGARLRLHHRDRHPQHAAGGAGVATVRRSSRSRCQTTGQRTGTVVEFDRTEAIFTNPTDPRTEDYVTGRFG